MTMSTNFKTSCLSVHLLHTFITAVWTGCRDLLSSQQVCSEVTLTVVLTLQQLLHFPEAFFTTLPHFMWHGWVYVLKCPSLVKVFPSNLFIHSITILLKFPTNSM